MGTVMMTMMIVVMTMMIVMMTMMIMMVTLMIVMMMDKKSGMMTAINVRMLVTVMKRNIMIYAVEEK